MPYNPKEHWKTRPMLIKFKHLNPAAQDIIGSGLTGMSPTVTIFNTIKGTRFVRFLSEASLLSILTMIGTITMHRWRLQPSEFKKAVGVAVAAGTSLATARTLLARVIQKRHKDLVESMKNNGILQTCFEKNYPRDWINPTIVSNTHPVFYVKANGDLVFLRNNRWEYARYAFQKGFAGKLGLNLWRWRAYIEPPTAPKPVMEWAKQQAAKWAERLVPKRKPALGIVQVAKKNYAKTILRRRLHYAK